MTATVITFPASVIRRIREAPPELRPGDRVRLVNGLVVSALSVLSHTATGRTIEITAVINGRATRLRRDQLALPRAECPGTGDGAPDPGPPPAA